MNDICIIANEMLSVGETTMSRRAKRKRKTMLKRR